MYPCGTREVVCYAGIGSRETPDPILRIMRRLGKILCDMRYRLRSGGADGADLAFHLGARDSSLFYTVGAEIFIPWNGFSDLFEDTNEGIINAGYFRDTNPKAEEIAIAARGTSNGLTRGGLMLQTRNAYQVLGRDLENPVRLVICYAEVKSNGRVRGGTNTAVQIARQRNIEVINLATEEGYARAMAFLKKHEI